ncbi:MAG TPA: serine hydrolase domain-containing protein [Microbacteriaceae bacterium]|nr:serine hydrolase domain-containing protein [Microbacteriaceae bacterium]
MVLKINHYLKGLALLGAGALLLTGCTSSGPSRTPLPETTLGSTQLSAVDAAVKNAMQLSDSTEAVVGVWSDKGDYVSSFALESDREFDAAALFRAAQTLQPMLCALVLTQVAEGTLSLDRELSRDIPRQTGIGNITYREACDGTSGLPDFKSKFKDAYLENPTRPWPPGQLIAEALIQPELSWPGLDVHRSDSNAVLLGRALSVSSGEDLEELLKESIYAPANMADTGIPSKENNELPGNNNLAGIGYLPGPNCEAGIVDFSEVSVTILGDSGNAITTVTDIKNFYEHLFQGTFGGEAGLATLTDVKPTKNPERDENGEATEEIETTSYRGFGVLKRGPLWGYDGALPGSATAAWHNPETGFSVVVALNNSTAGAGFATNLAFEIAALIGEPDLPWTAEEQAEKLAKAAVCKEEAEETE